MRGRLMWLLYGLPMIACLLSPASAAPPAAPLANKVALRYDIEADGQYTATVHIQRTAGTEAAAHSLDLFSREYSPSCETVDIVSAFLLKANGEKLAISPSDVHDQGPDPGIANDATSDERAKLIPFLNFGVGDAISVELHDHMLKPRWPGLFSLALLYDRSQAWDAPGHSHRAGFRWPALGGDRT